MHYPTICQGTDTTRCTTPVPTPTVRPIFRMPILLSSRMRPSTAGFTGRRPSFVRFARALASPAFTRSRIMGAGLLKPDNRHEGLAPSRARRAQVVRAV